MNLISLKNAHCTALQTHAPVEFLAGAGKGNRFKIEAYTGGVIDRWWGKLAIDLAGITAKNAMPVFRNHDRSAIVGYSSRAWAAASFFVEGFFVEATEAAREVKALAAEGFPWQASIGVAPLKILKLEAGATLVVNGREVLGPAEVWQEATVYETSFVPLGADGNTGIDVFAEASTTVEQARARWDADPELRVEFNNTFEAYAAFLRAEAAGRVKIIKPTSITL